MKEKLPELNLPKKLGKRCQIDFITYHTFWFNTGQKGVELNINMYPSIQMAVLYESLKF
jgi:hypothetical protein